MGLKDKLKQYGWKNSFARAVKTIFRQLGIEYEQYLYCTQNIPDLSQYSLSLSNGFKLKETILEDYVDSSLLIFETDKLNLYRKRYSAGSYKSFGVYKNDYLVYSCWVSLDVLELPGGWQDTLDTNEGLLLDAICHKDFRGLHLHSKMNFFRLKELQKAGKSKAVVLLLKENTPARRSQHKAGFKCDSIILLRRMWRRKASKKIRKEIQLV